MRSECIAGIERMTAKRTQHADMIMSGLRLEACVTLLPGNSIPLKRCDLR